MACECPSPRSAVARPQKHLDDGLMPDVRVWMPVGLGDYVYEGGYTPMLFGWETSIEPKYLIHSGESVHGKKIKVVKVVVAITSVIRSQKGFSICDLDYLMKLCPSDGLWVRKKTLILSGTWRGWRFLGRTSCPSKLAGKKLEEDASDERYLMYGLVL
ncbi:hypothetical protein ACLOJK_027907 [Asimina triloba]